MNIINLTNDEISQVKYKISHFPDGQTDIIIDSSTLNSTHKSCQISSYFNSWEDLALIICATKALRKLKYNEIHLYIPYILGARSDRKFQKGGTSYLVDIVAPILNAQFYESVTCIDAHSEVAQACIRNLEVIDNVELVIWSIEKIYQSEQTRFTITSPDQGSLKKIYNVCEKIVYQSEILICNKHRDLVTGKILSTNVPLTNLQLNQDFIIIDDICDGGRTFIEIAKGIRQKYEGRTWTGKIYLIVTHGIFSNHFNELRKYVDSIYTTNSICEGYDNGHIIGDKGCDIVRQMNIFDFCVESILN